MSKIQAMGWVPEHPDINDFSVDHEEIKPHVAKIGIEDPSRITIPGFVDLRRWCSPIENQESIGSCTANAGVGMIEFYEKRAFNKHIDASRLFLYKVTRNLLQWTGDTGAYLRTTMAGMVLFGVPPEKYWPYDTSKFDEEPNAFCYSFAQNFQALRYYRLDPLGTPKDKLLKRIKTNLAHKMPSMFGFTVYASISQARNNGKIPFPTKGDKRRGGHAVMAVGYDDEMVIENTAGNQKTRGALLIKNSWGESWGDEGYGWLPYDYVTRGLANDWWALMKKEWVDTGKFAL